MIGTISVLTYMAFVVKPLFVNVNEDNDFQPDHTEQSAADEETSVTLDPVGSALISLSTSRSYESSVKASPSLIATTPSSTMSNYRSIHCALAAIVRLSRFLAGPQ